VLTIAIALRWNGAMPPFDDAYHLKRISAFPPLIEFDRDRGENGAWCPWPPLYDIAMSAVPRVEWAPVVGFAAFAAALAWLMTMRAGWIAGGIAGSAAAISPYLIGVSRRGAIDHHWVEPALVVAILFAMEARRPLLLALSLTVAMFVQTALLVAAAIAFAILFCDGYDSPRGEPRFWISFAIPALAIAMYRVTRPPGYPDTIWFLGWAHAALFAAAAIVLVDAPHRGIATLIAATLLAPFLPTLASGTNFFSGDPWLRSILEFQPMFRDAAGIGTDIANLTGGALLAFTLWRRERTVAIFSIAYLLLALSSRRFLVPAIAIFAIAGALAAVKRPWIAALATLLPPLCYQAYAIVHREPQDTTVIAIARTVATKPPGRVLAPWWIGHAIDVIGKHPVVIDNFGSMAGETVFANASDALLQRHPDMLRDYMKQRGVHYLVLPDAAGGLPATAAAIGIDATMYRGTRLARSTVWWKLTHHQPVPGFDSVP